MDYIDGADLIANEAIEQVILNGEMRSYGLEVMLRKNTGKFSGWIAYTLSRSEQRTPGRTALETGINNGNWYRSAYDKTHNLAVTSSYKFNKNGILEPISYFKQANRLRIQMVNIPIKALRCRVMVCAMKTTYRCTITWMFLRL